MTRFSAHKFLAFAALTLLLGLASGNSSTPPPASAANEETCLKGTITWPGVFESNEATGFISYESNTISLCFPPDGGTVRGDLNVNVLRDDIWLQRGLKKTLGKDPGPPYEDCISRYRTTGSFEGTYTGGKITGSLPRWTVGSEIVRGCANTRYEPAKTEDVGAVISLTFDGRQARGTLSYGSGATYYEFPIEASLVSGGTPKQESAPGKEVSKNGPAATDNSDADLNGKLAGIGLDWMRDGIDTDKILDGMWKNYAAKDSKERATVYMTDIVNQYNDAIEYNPLLTTQNDRRSRAALGKAALMSEMKYGNGSPMFPSVRESLRIIAVMAVKGSVHDRDMLAVERYVNLLAAMDVARAGNN